MQYGALDDAEWHRPRIAESPTEAGLSTCLRAVARGWVSQGRCCGAGLDQWLPLGRAQSELRDVGAAADGQAALVEGTNVGEGAHAVVDAPVHVSRTAEVQVRPLNTAGTPPTRWA